MPALELLAQPVAQRVTLTLVHFVWQGFVVAALLMLVLWCLAPRHASARYACSLVAMMLMTIAPLVTFVVLSHSSIAPFAAADESSEPGSGSVVAQRTAATEKNMVERESSHSPDLDWAGALRVAQPSLFAAWLGGVALLSSRLSLSMWSVVWLRWQREPLKEAQHFAPLAQRMGFDAHNRLFASLRVREAMVVGFWRPLVLLPASWLTEMPLDMLEAVIAHELAHIRRWDLLVNLFQRIVETLLFYHPAVWWLSRRVRLEREMCCDELAVAATGNRVAYANALEVVARKRTEAAPMLAAAIRGERRMNLLNRVRNVLQLSPQPKHNRWWPVGLLSMAVLVGLVLGSSVYSDEERNARTPNRETVTSSSREKRHEDRRVRHHEEEEEREQREDGVVDVSERVYRVQRDDGEYEIRETRRTIVDRQVERVDTNREKRRGERRRWPDEENNRSELRPTDDFSPHADRGDRDRDETFDRGRHPSEDDARRPPREGEAELIRLIRELRSEVSELRREVQQLRRDRKDEPDRRRVGARDERGWWRDTESRESEPRGSRLDARRRRWLEEEERESVDRDESPRDDDHHFGFDESHESDFVDDEGFEDSDEGERLEEVVDFEDSDAGERLEEVVDFEDSDEGDDDERLDDDD